MTVKLIYVTCARLGLNTAARGATCVNMNTMQLAQTNNVLPMQNHSVQTCIFCVTIRSKNTATDDLDVPMAAMFIVCAAISHLMAITACGRPRSSRWLPKPLVAATEIRMVYQRKRNYKRY